MHVEMEVCTDTMNKDKGVYIEHLSPHFVDARWASKQIKVNTIKMLIKKSGLEATGLVVKIPVCSLASVD